jgi:hypothetical protein
VQLWPNRRTRNSAFKGTLVLGRIQPTVMADPRVIHQENSAATLEGCNIVHSIKPSGVPVVCEPDSPGLSPTSEALARAGETAGALSHNDEVPESADRVRVVGELGRIWCIPSKRL